VTPRSPSLLRQLGIASATALVVSNMIGTGIFTTTGFLAGQLGSARLILAIWVVGAICALAGAFCYSELGINFPSSGGEYVYLTEAFGPTWGFMTGWASFFAGFSAPIAVSALAVSAYLSYFFPALKLAASARIFGSGEWEFRAGPAQLTACGVIAVFTLLNCAGVRRTARVQNALTGTKILVILAFLIAGFLIGEGSWTHFTQAAARTSTTPIASQFIVSLFYIYFAYSGWNAATYVAEELKHPARTLPISLAFGTLLVGALFVGLNVLFIYAMPLESMKGIVAIGSASASQLFPAESQLGSAASGLFSGAMALSLLATVNAMVTIGPRIYYAMAKNGAFFAAAAKVDPRWRTPVIAIVCQGACSMLMTMTPFLNLLFYIGFTLNFFAVLSVASLFVFRRRANWRKLGVVNFAYPLFPLFFVLTGIWMTIFGMTFRPTISLAAIVTIGAGAVVYHFRMRAQRATP
jgi:APA family basic amino acid/polyamine antiporter